MKNFLRHLRTYYYSLNDSRQLNNTTTNVTCKYTLGITTFDKRFKKYLCPLIEQIAKAKPNVEIIIAINGNYNKGFNQAFRKEILQFTSKYDNVFPVFFPEFRSLAKMWNTILVHSTNHSVLMLNDDISINFNFWDKFEKAINLKNGNCFTINNSYSHFFINRIEVNKLGWFDERLLGIGDEDGDFAWRYESFFNKKVDNIYIKEIFNHVEMNDCEQDFIKQGSSKKYSDFNRKYILEKYINDDINGNQFGLFPGRLVCKIDTKNQYPYESFYWEKKHSI